MYLKGYQVRYGKDSTINLPKWDFGGDKSHTHSVWNNVLSKLRSLPQHSFPLYITDLDEDNSTVIKIKSIDEFEVWLRMDYV